MDTETLTLEKPGQVAQEERNYDDNPVFSTRAAESPRTARNRTWAAWGLTSGASAPERPSRARAASASAWGPAVHAGSGGEGSGFGGRGSGHRKAMLASGGGTKQSERAVAGALNWLARHQSANGSWGLMAYKARCKDGTCTGPGGAGDRPAAATALGLLPFLAAGQTHKSKGPYQKHDRRRRPVPCQPSEAGRRLCASAWTQMYDHGLAAIALCECYGMSNDERPAAPCPGGAEFHRRRARPQGRRLALRAPARRATPRSSAGR